MEVIAVVLIGTLRDKVLEKYRQVVLIVRPMIKRFKQAFCLTDGFRLLPS